MIKNILFPIDLEHESSWRPVLPTAVEISRGHKARLHIMTVAPRLHGAPGLPSPADFGQKGPTLEEYNDSVLKAAEKRLDTFVKENVPDEVATSRIVVSGISAYREILDAARNIPADLIIMSAYRPSLKSFLLGTTAERVVRHADCSVYVVRP